MSAKRFKDNKYEPDYKQYLILEDEPDDNMSHHRSLVTDIDYWESRSMLKHRILKNARKLKREFQK